MAKANYYFNVVLADNPEVLVLLELGKKAGDSLIFGMEKKGWTDIAHPKANEGRELQITKTKDGKWFFYSVDPVMQNADYDVPDSVLSNLYNLDNVIDLVNSGTANVMKISDLKEGETLKVRLCPPWDNGNGNRRVASYIYRHWGVTEDHVNGQVSLDEDFSTERATPKTGHVASTTVEREVCFGSPEIFSEEDEACTKDCKDYAECAVLVETKLKRKAAAEDDIPF